MEPAATDAPDVTAAVAAAQAHVEKKEWEAAIQGWDTARTLCDRGPTQPCASSALIYLRRAQAKLARIPPLPPGSSADPRILSAGLDADAAGGDATEDELRFEIERTQAAIATASHPRAKVADQTMLEYHTTRAWCFARKLMAQGKLDEEVVEELRRKLPDDPCKAYVNWAEEPWQVVSSWSDLASRLVATNKLSLPPGYDATNDSDLRSRLDATGGSPWVLREGDVLNGNIEDGNAILIVDTQDLIGSRQAHLLFREEHIAPNRKELARGCRSLDFASPKVVVAKDDQGFPILELIRHAGFHNPHSDGLGCGRDGAATRIDLFEPISGGVWNGVHLLCGDEPFKLSTASATGQAFDTLTVTVGSCENTSTLEKAKPANDR